MTTLCWAAVAAQSISKGSPEKNASEKNAYFKEVVHTTRKSVPHQRQYTDSESQNQIHLRETQLAIAQSKDEMDLHGFQASNAKATSLIALKEWVLRQKATAELKGKKSCGFVPFILITGKGLHSRGSPVIKPAVKGVLTSNGYTFRDCEGHLIVTGRRL